MLAGTAACAEPAMRIDIDTGARSLTVYGADEQVLARFDDISVGRGGVAAVHYKGDHSTPLGHYRIVAVHRPHRYDTFYELDYPTPVHAELAYAAGRLKATARAAIDAAHAAGHRPPSNTALGGGIGIHGIGQGSLAVHQAFNWTNGCVALTNEQLHSLGEWAVPGTAVDIR